MSDVLLTIAKNKPVEGEVFQVINQNQPKEDVMHSQKYTSADCNNVPVIYFYGKMVAVTASMQACCWLQVQRST